MVRQLPPELRCWTLTGRMVRSASLFVKMSRSGRVAKRRIMSSYFRNRRAIRRGAFPGAGCRGAFAGEPGPGKRPVAAGEVLQDAGVQRGLPGVAGVPGGVAGLDEQGGHAGGPVLLPRLEVVQVFQVAQEMRPAPGVQ